MFATRGLPTTSCLEGLGAMAGVMHYAHSLEWWLCTPSTRLILPPQKQSAAYLDRWKHWINQLHFTICFLFKIALPLYRSGVVEKRYRFNAGYAKPKLLPAHDSGRAMTSPSILNRNKHIECKLRCLKESELIMKHCCEIQRYRIWCSVWTRCKASVWARIWITHVLFRNRFVYHYLQAVGNEG